MADRSLHTVDGWFRREWRKLQDRVAALEASPIIRGLASLTGIRLGDQILEVVPGGGGLQVQTVPSGQTQIITSVPGAISHLYVLPTGSDTNTGQSWGSALQTINAAVAKLDSDGGIIEVGTGYSAGGTIITRNIPIEIIGYGVTLSLAGTEIGFLASRMAGPSAQPLTLSGFTIAGDAGIYPTFGSTVGVQIINSDLVTLRDFHWTDCGIGVELRNEDAGSLYEFCENNSVEDSRFYHCGAGIKFYAGTASTASFGQTNLENVGMDACLVGIDFGSDSVITPYLYRGDFKNVTIWPAVGTIANPSYGMIVKGSIEGLRAQIGIEGGGQYSTGIDVRSIIADTEPAFAEIVLAYTNGAYTDTNRVALAAGAALKYQYRGRTYYDEVGGVYAGQFGSYQRMGDADDRSRFEAISTGAKLNFGSGAVAPDTDLYRASADHLKTDDSLEVAAELNCSSVVNAFKPPRVTTAQKNAIAAPSQGMVVYDTTLNYLCSYDGGAWVGIAAGVGYVVGNAPIAAATKTKISYDTKGLVTAGADATTADIADSVNKRYCTDAEKVVIGNTSNTNTGDQTLASIGAAPASGIAPSAITGTAAVTGDARFPTSDQKAALAGTDGTPSSSDKYVTNSDSRNTNARAPTTHAATTHKTGQSDAIAPADIGAAPASGIAPSAITGTAVVKTDIVLGLDYLLRSSEVSTMGYLDQTATVGALTSTYAYGCLAICLKAQTYTKIRFMTGSTPPSGTYTDCRAGVHNSAGVAIAVTAESHATVTSANTLYTLNLVSGVALTLGQAVYLSLGFIATGMPTIRGGAVTNSAIENLVTVDTGVVRTLYVDGFTTGNVLPKLTSGGSTRTLWMELMP